MMTQQIKDQINEAMKSGDEVRVSTLKMLSSAFHNAKINKGLRAELDEDEVFLIVKKEAKKRKDAIESLQQAKGKVAPEQESSIDEKIEREKKELEILQEYLPEPMSDQELALLVDKVITIEGGGNIQDMGRVIGKVMEMSKGRADGSKVAKMVKEKLI